MRAQRSNPKAMHRAGSLRKHLTPAEAKLWAYLRGSKLRGVNFRRQHAIGPYIVDFCSPKHKLIIEVDGSGHMKQEEYDEARSTFLAVQGYRVLRFWNDQVMTDMNGVAQAILDAINIS